jgi:hypothetical protein
LAKIVAVTETFILIECEYVKASQAFKNREEASAYSEEMKGKICKYCGYQRDAALRKPPLHMVCLHKESRWWSKWLQQVKKHKNG